MTRNPGVDCDPKDFLLWPARMQPLKEIKRSIKAAKLTLVRNTNASPLDMNFVRGKKSEYLGEQLALDLEYSFL
jgi:hypothetical protein